MFRVGAFVRSRLLPSTVMFPELGLGVKGCWVEGSGFGGGWR